jgi:hypothetical protein
MLVSHTNMYVSCTYVCTYVVSICTYFFAHTFRYISSYLTKIRAGYVQTGSLMMRTPLARKQALNLYYIIPPLLFRRIACSLKAQSLQLQTVHSGMDGSKCWRGRPGFCWFAVFQKLRTNNLYIVVQLLD